MSNPKISIIIPVYNTEKFIKECLDSIINQTFKDIEIICINDGSTDNSLNILNEYKDIDNRIRVFSQENSGAGVARNLGIEKSKGDYILFVDGDDWIKDNTCEKLYAQAIKLDTDMILFDAIEHKPNNKFRKRIYFPNDSFKEDYNTFTFDYHFRKNLVMNGMLVIWSKFYKTSFIKENNIKFYNHEVFNDVQFHIASMLFAKKIGYNPKIFYHYNRLGQPSLQNNNVKTQKSFILLDIFAEIKDFLIKNKFMDEFELNYLRFVITESENNLIKINYETKIPFFKKIKELFELLSVSSKSLNELPLKNSKFYINVLTCETYQEFNNLTNIHENKITDYEGILLNKLHEKNENIYDLKKENEILKKENEIFTKMQDDYLSNNTLILDSYSKIKQFHLFDSDYYRYHEKYNGNIHPYIHYIYQGFEEGKNPSKLFDNNFYIKHNKSEMNPLIYFVNYALPQGKIRIRPEINQPKSVNKLDIDKKLEKFNSNGLTENKRNPQLIVSLTSYPKRIDKIKYTLYSLLTQKLKPDRLILWLAHTQFPNKENDIPKDVLCLKENGLEIKWCEDIKSFKKLIPSLREFPNDLIVTVDDDIYLPDDWLEKLYNYHIQYPNYIICHRAKKIKINDTGKLCPYNEWELITEENEPSLLNFITGGAGALYPPKSLDDEIFNDGLFMELAPTSDDIWFWSMAVKNGTKIKIVKDNMYQLTYVSPEEEYNIFGDASTLWISNSTGLNDIHMDNVLKKFPEILNKIRE